MVKSTCWEGNEPGQVQPSKKYLAISVPVLRSISPAKIRVGKAWRRPKNINKTKSYAEIRLGKTGEFHGRRKDLTLGGKEGVQKIF